MKTLLLAFTLFCLPIIGNAQDREADSLILVQLYETLDGPNWNNPENWLSTEPLDTWKGIFLQDDRVVKVELISQGTSGTFPNEILGLDQLHTFEVRQGSVSGEIPAELTQLTKLRRFMMGGTGISGDILNIWKDFEDLNSLGLARNNLTGSLPDIPEKLTLLYIDRNELSGPIPASWASSNVSALQIQGNNLTGSFENFANWLSLKSIDLGGNDWDASTFPEWLDDLPNLERFSCDDCNLEGEIPATLDFSNTIPYRGMFISDNNLSGDISLLFNGEDSEFQLYLRARNNNFSGEFPAHKLSNVTRIDVRGNHFSSMTNINPDLSFNTYDVSSNDFNYSQLTPVQNYIALDSIIGVIYDPQNALLSNDTLYINTSTTLTIDAGDNHPNTNFEWKKNGSIIEGETSSTLILEISEMEDAGSYTCQMSNSDFPELTLSRNPVLINVDISSSIDDLEDESFSVFPNPTTGIINIDKKSLSNHSTITIYNTIGIPVLRSTAARIFDITELPQGNYIIEIQEGKKTFTQRVTKL